MCLVGQAAAKRIRVEEERAAAGGMLEYGSMDRYRKLPQEREVGWGLGVGGWGGG